jgi:hypothetical protein
MTWEFTDIFEGRKQVGGRGRGKTQIKELYVPYMFTNPIKSL